MSEFSFAICNGIKESSHIYLIMKCRILLELPLPLTYSELSPYAIGYALGFDKALAIGFIQISWFFPQ